MNTNSSKRLLELDTLRGIAVVLVIFFHLTMKTELSNYGFKLGVTGVDLFFVISGFVILLTLEKTNHWKDFIISRISRLYPTYWFCVSFTTLLILLSNLVKQESLAKIPIAYLANMTMFQAYFRVPDLDGPYWTMRVEMLFYLVMLFVFLTKNLKRIEVIGCLGLLIVVSQHFLLNTKYKSIALFISHAFPLINHFPLFLAGITLYKIKFDRSTIVRYLVMLLCFTLQYHLFFDGGSASTFISQTEYGYSLVFYCGVFILYTNNALGFIVNQISVFLGKISYSLYLVHQFVSLEIMMPILTKYFHINFWIAAFGITFPIVLLIAITIYRYIEKPAMSYVRSRTKNKLQPIPGLADRSI